MPYRFGNVYTIALALTGLLTFTVAVATLRHRDERASIPLAGFLFGIGLWATGDALRLAALSRPSIMLWNDVAYLGVVLVPPTLLTFVLSYTGRQRWLGRRHIVALGSISVLAYAIILTNPSHHLWFEVASVTPGTAPPVLVEIWGPLWYVWATYVYGVVAVVVYLVAKEFVYADRSSIHRGQTGLVLTGLLVAAIVNLLFIFDLVPFDPAPFSFAITGLCFGAALFRYQLLTLLPIARDTVVSEMDSGVLVLDSEDKVVDVNQQLRTMFELERVVVDGLRVADVFDDYQPVLACLASDQPDTISVERDGEHRYYDVTVSRMYDAVETGVGRVVVFTDVTQRMRQQEQLEERTAELEQMNERLDQFAQVVSHDLRNRLNVVTVRADLARTRDDPETHLEIIDDATDQMERMIDEILTLARQGELAGDVEPTDVAVAARRAWDLVDADGADLTVETNRRVLADRDRLQELFENTFTNAVLHGGPTVQVRVGRLPDGFFIEDDGPGIPDDDREAVFEAGYTTADDGTGFGLNIVREIAEVHGWTVTATDSERGGARFEITGCASARGIESG